MNAFTAGKERQVYMGTAPHRKSTANKPKQGGKNMKMKNTQCYNCNEGVIAYTRLNSQPVWGCVCKEEKI